MNHAIASMTLRAPGDVAAARLAARKLAEHIGLDRHAQTKLATAVSEIARNAMAYAGGGEVRFAVKGTDRPELLSVTVCDRGPGIADLDAVLSGQKAFAPGFGTGLVSARRLVDEFDVRARDEGGTEVLLAQRIPPHVAARLQVQTLKSLATALPQRRQDLDAALDEQNRELLQSLTDLNERQAETTRLNRELEETNRGVVALYSELEEKADQLRTVSDLKSRFLSHMSHEFRTPLNSILALSRLLADRVDGELNAEQERQVEYIRRAASDLLEMVNDLLDLAKVEAGKLEVKPSAFTVEDLFTTLRGALKPLMVNPAVDLVFDEPRDLPALWTDEFKVGQILRNFVSNALKFTEVGEVHVSAVLDAERNRVVFCVKDSGVGIAPEHQALIFEEFSQVEGRLQRGGTGLGLPLARRLALLLGGEVTLVSAPDAGSTFCLELPPRWGEVTASDAPREGTRVLVVDDEEAFRYVIRHIAQDAGFGVLEAGDGARGLQLVRSERPDLVVLDLNMPEMDGYEFLIRLAADEATARVPVIVCSSQSLTLEHKRRLAGAYAIVPKHDISRDGLSQLMRGVLAAQKAQP